MADRYIVHFQYEDGGHGTSPALYTVKGTKKVKEAIANHMGWLPEPLRAEAVEAFWKKLDRWGVAEVRMEDVGEEFVNEGRGQWEDFEDLDTEAELDIRFERDNNPAKENPAALRRSLTRR